MKREEYLDDYQDHAERRPKKKKKKKKRKHRVYAFSVLLFAFLIFVLGSFILFHVQKVEVKGNDYCSTEDIRSMGCMCLQNINSVMENSRTVLKVLR